MGLFEKMAETVASAAGIIERQNAAIERIKALHDVRVAPGEMLCLGCGQVYPCDTIKALEG